MDMATVAADMDYQYEHSIGGGFEASCDSMADTAALAAACGAWVGYYTTDIRPMSVLSQRRMLVRMWRMLDDLEVR